MQDLKRPLTVRFPTRGLGDVIQVLTEQVKVENIKAIRITEDECRVTVTDVTTKQTLGEIVERSMRRGKVRGTNVETGTRYLSLYDAVEMIPSEIPLGDFVLRVYCDNNRVNTVDSPTTHTTIAQMNIKHREHASDASAPATWLVTATTT